MEIKKTLDIAFALYKHYGEVEEIQHYYGLVALYGLVQASFEKGDETQLEQCRRILDRYPDKIVHPYYNFPCYRVGGNASAWACMKGIHDRSREELEIFAERTMAGPKESRGILCMPGGEKEGKIWIDVATAVTPFMLFTGLTCGRDTLILRRSNVSGCMRLCWIPAVAFCTSAGDFGKITACVLRTTGQGETVGGIWLWLSLCSICRKILCIGQKQKNIIKICPRQSCLIRPKKDCGDRK